MFVGVEGYLMDERGFVFGGWPRRQQKRQGQADSVGVWVRFGNLEGCTWRQQRAERATE